MTGREHEIERLKKTLQSNHSELIAVYGRRRVGKTYLIHQVYEKNIRLEVTGLYGGNTAKQLNIFFEQLLKECKKLKEKDAPSDWKEAFELLKLYITSLKGTEKKVIFFDEIPWLDTHKSGFRIHFADFWNTFCEKRNDLIIVLCGSAASYMVQNVLSKRSSLHDRLTYILQIKPFTLCETKKYLECKNIKCTLYHILQLYMTIGGIPQYLSKVRKGESAVQTIQRMCFDETSDLINEFEEIFDSTFAHSTSHKAIVRALGNVNKGIIRDELIQKSKQYGGGAFTRALDELIASGFVSKYPSYDKKTKRTLYRLSDEYSKFYLKYIEPNKNQGAGFWKNTVQKQSYISWAGFNFETICLKHVNQIKKALKIEGIYSTYSSWSSANTQADLLIKRADRRINLCEMKFYPTEYKIGKAEIECLKKKVAEFKQDARTKDSVAVTMITTFGLVQNETYHEVIENDFKMDILFEPN